MSGPIETVVLHGGLTLEVFEDADAVARHGAGWLAGALTRIVRRDGRCTLAISGGRSPWVMFRMLAEMPQVPWDGVQVVQVDEREAPDGDAARNWTNAEEVFGACPGVSLYPMPVTAPDREAAASAYARTLDHLCGGVPDICHLGLGEDGHTASLFPDDPVHQVVDRPVAWTTGLHGGHRRMTLTLAALNRARHVVWQVVGASKQAMLARLLEGDESIPAGLVRRDATLVLTDTQTRPPGG